jgi:lipopolysaccharide transport system permease protein
MEHELTSHVVTADPHGLVAEFPLVVIEPSRGWISLRLQDLWRFRELLYFLVWRDMKVRYKQTLLGVFWAIVQPVLTTIIFSLFFGRLAKVPSEGIPYPIFCFAALVPWNFFANGMSQASNSLVGSADLVKKVYFPRLILPTAGVLSGVVDSCLSFLILLVMMFHYGLVPSYRTVFLPLFALLALCCSLGVSLWLSAMNVQFRDVRYIVPFLTQFWLFATPIAYPSTLLSPRWRAVYGLNPMAGVVEGFRWALLGTEAAPGPLVLVSAVVSLAFLTSGAFYFRRMEKTFADIV